MKGKVNPLNAIQALRGEKSYSSYSLLTSAARQWSASLPGRGLPLEGTPGTHWTGGWLDVRACSDAESREKKPFPFSGIEPQFSP
jgi:hypothetical protein